MNQNTKSARCPACQPLGDSIKISNPTTLKDVLLTIKQLILEGKLKDISPDPSQFSTLPPAGPYPDIITHHFHCSSCENIFELSVETYHGLGGFMKIND